MLRFAFTSDECNTTSRNFPDKMRRRRYRILASQAPLTKRKKEKNRMKGLFITGSTVETPGSPGRAGSRPEPKGQVLQGSEAHRHNPAGPPAEPGIPPELIAGREPPVASPRQAGAAARYPRRVSAARAGPVGGRAGGLHLPTRSSPRSRAARAGGGCGERGKRERGPGKRWHLSEPTTDLGLSLFPSCNCSSPAARL